MIEASLFVLGAAVACIFIGAWMMSQHEPYKPLNIRDWPKK